MLQSLLKRQLGDRQSFEEKSIRMIKHYDVVLVTAGLIIGFSVIVMHLTGIWPCNILYKLDNLSISGKHHMNSTNELNLNKVMDEIHYLRVNFFLCK